MNKPSRKTVGDATLSPSFKYIFWLLPFVQVLPLMIPFLFSLMRLTDSSACLLSAYVSSSGSNVITADFTGIATSSNYFNYFIIADISLSPNKAINFFSCICVNITLTSAWMYSCLCVLFVISYYFIKSCIFHSHTYRCSLEIVDVYSHSCISYLTCLVVIVPLMFHNLICSFFANCFLLHHSAYLYL